MTKQQERKLLQELTELRREIAELKSLMLSMHAVGRPEIGRLVGLPYYAPAYLMGDVLYGTM